MVVQQSGSLQKFARANAQVLPTGGILQMLLGRGLFVTQGGESKTGLHESLLAIHFNTVSAVICDCAMHVHARCSSAFISAAGGDQADIT